MNIARPALPRSESGSLPQPPVPESGPRAELRPLRTAPGVAGRGQATPEPDEQVRLRAILDGTPALIVLVDRGRILRFANRSAQRWFAEPTASVAGRAIHEVFDPRVHAAIDARWSDALAGREVVFQVATTLAGAPRRVQVSLALASETFAGAASGVIVTAAEIVEPEADSAKPHDEYLAAMGARLQAEIETERRRIASALHDQTGQDLTALRVHVGRILRRWSHDAALTGIALRMNAIIDGAGASIRRIIANLRPLLLDDLGIAAAARALAQETERSTGIAFDLALDAGPDQLSADQNTALYRVLQECLTNIVRHAGANECGIVLERDGSEVCLRVRDDGCGFSPNLVAGTRSSYGLFGIAERARRLGGSCWIDSAPGRGTTVEFRLPVATRPAGGDGSEDDRGRGGRPLQDQEGRCASKF